MPPRTQKSAFSEEDIVMYVALALKHLRLMVLLVCFSLMLGLVYYDYARPIYHSKALVQVRMVPQPLDTETIYHDSNERTLRNNFAAEGIIERTARRFGVHASYPEITAKYLKKVTVAFDSQRNLTIEIWPYSAEWAVKWPEAMVLEYLSWREEHRLELTEAITKSFNDDMAQMKKKMSENIETKFDARQSNQMTEIKMALNHYREIPTRLGVITNQQVYMALINIETNSAGRDTVAKLSILSGALRELQARETERRRVSEINVNIGDVVHQNDAADTVALPSMVTASTAPMPWEEMDKQRTEKQREYAELGRKYLPKFPKMVALTNEINAINRKLESELDRACVQWQAIDGKLVTEQQKLLAELPTLYKVELQYALAMKDYTSFDGSELPWSKYYAEMNKRLEALEFGADNERARLWYDHMIDTPKGPDSPNGFRLMLLSLMLGLALAIAVPFLIEYLNSRISDVDQIEEALHIRSLGVLPKVTDVAMDEVMSDYGEAKGEQHIQENFRLIRTNLVMNSATPAMPQVILITSSMPQEGKTVVAFNLAHSFARKGEKTLIINADLRRGRLHRISACQNKPGLSEVLADNLPVLDSCRVIGRGTVNGNLSLLPCGKHVHSASELLDSPRFSKLIDELRQKYQRIIINTPPVLGLSETSIIQRAADGVLLVIWSDWTPMRDVRTAVQTLQTNGAKFLGFVLNRLDFKALTNRYKYFYYSPYYYANYQPPEPPPPSQLTAAE